MIAKTIRTCFPIAAAAVSDKAEEINKLNVFPVPNGDKAQRLGGLGGLFLILVDLGGTVVGLHLHVVDKDLIDLTELQHVLEHQVGGVGVHMDLVVGIGAHEQLTVAHGA